MPTMELKVPLEGKQLPKPSVIRIVKSPLEGKQLEVIPFLSNNGKTTKLVRSQGVAGCLDVVDLRVVEGKYLIIVCVSLPLGVKTSESNNFLALIDAYKDLPRDVSDMVLVIHMKPGFEQNEKKFLKFLGKFLCLAIPFSDSETRLHISSTIVGPNPYKRDVNAIIMNPSGCVLQSNMIVQHFVSYGSEWFPFDHQKIKDIIDEDDVLRFRLDPFYKEDYVTKSQRVLKHPLLGTPLSLHKDILLCDSSTKLWRVCRSAVSSTVSELSTRYVGLYLYIDGECMKEVTTAYKLCREKNKNFEIILVSLPLFEDTSIYLENLNLDLRRYGITSWFLLPFDSYVSRRLWRAFGQEWNCDRLIILPPYCQNGELEGKAVITRLGEDLYPFTRSSIRKQWIKHLKSLTPFSWFKNKPKGMRTCLTRNGQRSKVHKSELKGKKVLLYLDWVHFPKDNGELCHLLLKHYPEMQKKGWEVVFVPLDLQDVKTHHVDYAKMPWPIMPITAAIKASVFKKLFFKDEYWENRVVALQTNGRIVSRHAEDQLNKYGVSDRVFRSNLHEEITEQLAPLQDP